MRIFCLGINERKMISVCVYDSFFRKMISIVYIVFHCHILVPRPSIAEIEACPVGML